MAFLFATSDNPSNGLPFVKLLIFGSHCEENQELLLPVRNPPKTLSPPTAMFSFRLFMCYSGFYTVNLSCDKRNLLKSGVLFFIISRWLAGSWRHLSCYIDISGIQNQQQHQKI